MQVLFNRDSLTFCKKVISSFIALTFLTSLIVAPAGAQVLPVLNNPVSLAAGYQPPVLLGLKIHPENPLLFDFIVDQGQSKLSTDELKSETTKLVKYFLAALTIPDKEVWVNLSPTEKDRIIPDVLGQTTMGKTMLEQDYVLKQLAASLTNPETDLGKKYWDQVNGVRTLDAGRLTLEKNSTTSVQPPMSSDFNKVWIMPAKAEVLESNGIVLVGEKRLKVMLAEDLTPPNPLFKKEGESRDALATPSLDKQSDTQLTPSLDKEGESGVTPSSNKENFLVTHSLDKEGEGGVLKSNLSSEIFRSTILPTIEKAVNEGKDFADVRQIYNSVILAAWYKKALKESLLGKIYTDKGKVAGVETDDKEMKQRIYEQYLAAFKKGAYNLIKEEADENGDLIPRKYFSGGIQIVEGSSVAGWKDFDLKITPINDEGIERVLQESGPILPFIVRILTEAEGPALGAVAAAQAQIDASSSGVTDVVASGKEKLTKLLSAFAAVLALSFASFDVPAVSLDFANAYVAEQNYRGRKLDTNGAKNELNINLDKMLQEFAQKNGGQITTDGLISFLNGAKSFDEVRARLQREAQKISSDNIKLGALQKSAARWVQSWIKASAVYDHKALEEIRKNSKFFGNISRELWPDNWRNVFIGNLRYQYGNDKENPKTFICGNEAELRIMILGDLGIFKGPYDVSVVPVIRNFVNQKQEPAGHVTPMLKFGDGDVWLSDNSQGYERKLNENVGHKVVRARQIVNGAVTANYSDVDATVKGNLQSIVGYTPQDIGRIYAAEGVLIKLIDKSNALPNQYNSEQAQGMVNTLSDILATIKELRKEPLLEGHPDVSQNLRNIQVSVEGNIANAKALIRSTEQMQSAAESLEHNFQIFLNLQKDFQKAKGMNPQDQKAVYRQIYQNAKGVLKEVGNLPNIVKLRTISKITRSDGSVDQSTQEVTPRTLGKEIENLIKSLPPDSKSASSGIAVTLPKDQELTSAEFEEGVLSSLISVGTKIVSFTYWASANEQSISTKTKIEKIDREKGKIKFEGYALMSLDKIISVTLAASSALDEERAQLVGKTFNVQKEIVHAVSLLQGGDSVTVTYKHFDGSKETTESPTGSIIEINGQTIGKKDRVIDGTTIVRVKVPSLEEDAYDIKGFTVQNILSITIDSLASSAVGEIKVLAESIQQLRDNPGDADIAAIAKIVHMATTLANSPDEIVIKAFGSRNPGILNYFSRTLASHPVIDISRVVRLIEEAAQSGQLKGDALTELQEAVGTLKAIAMSTDVPAQVNPVNFTGKKISGQQLISLLDALVQQPKTQSGMIKLIATLANPTPSHTGLGFEITADVEFQILKRVIAANDPSIGAAILNTTQAREKVADMVIDLSSLEQVIGSSEFISAKDRLKDWADFQAAQNLLSDAATEYEKSQKPIEPSPSIASKLSNEEQIVSDLRQGTIEVENRLHENWQRLIGKQPGYERYGSQYVRYHRILENFQNREQVSTRDLIEALVYFTQFNDGQVVTKDDLIDLFHTAWILNTSIFSYLEGYGETYPFKYGDKWELIGLRKQIEAVLIALDRNSLGANYRDNKTLFGPAADKVMPVIDATKAGKKIDVDIPPAASSTVDVQDVEADKRMFWVDKFWRALHSRKRNIPGMYDLGKENLVKIAQIGDLRWVGIYDQNENRWFELVVDSDDKPLAYGASMIPVQSDTDSIFLTFNVLRDVQTRRVALGKDKINSWDILHGRMDILKTITGRKSFIVQGKQIFGREAIERTAVIFYWKHGFRFINPINPLVRDLIEVMEKGERLADYQINALAHSGSMIYELPDVSSAPANSSSAPTVEGDFTKGGIDFDPTNMNLQIKRDGKGVPLPLPQQNLEQINIQGLFPVIINITPINAQTLPIFLGQAPKEPAREPELAANSAG